MAAWTPDPQVRRQVIQLLEMRERGDDVFLPRTLKDLAVRAVLQLPDINDDTQDEGFDAYWREKIPDELILYLREVISAREVLGDPIMHNSRDGFMRAIPDFAQYVVQIAFSRGHDDVSSTLRLFAVELIAEDSGAFDDINGTFMGPGGDGLEAMMQALKSDPVAAVRRFCAEAIGVMATHFDAAWLLQYSKDIRAWYEAVPRDETGQHAALCALDTIVQMWDRMTPDHQTLFHEGGAPTIIKRAGQHLTSHETVDLRSISCKLFSQVISSDMKFVPRDWYSRTCNETVSLLLHERRGTHCEGFVMLVAAMLASDISDLSEEELVIVGGLVIEWLANDPTQVHLVDETLALVRSSLENGPSLFTHTQHERILDLVLARPRYTPTEVRAWHVAQFIDSPSDNSKISLPDTPYTRAQLMETTLFALCNSGQIPATRILEKLEPFLASRDTLKVEAGLTGVIAILQAPHTMDLTTAQRHYILSVIEKGIGSTQGIVIGTAVLAYAVFEGSNIVDDRSEAYARATRLLDLPRLLSHNSQGVRIRTCEAVEMLLQKCTQGELDAMLPAEGAFIAHVIAGVAAACENGAYDKQDHELITTLHGLFDDVDGSELPPLCAALRVVDNYTVSESLMRCAWGLVKSILNGPDRLSITFGTTITLFNKLLLFGEEFWKSSIPLVPNLQMLVKRLALLIGKELRVVLAIGDVQLESAGENEELTQLATINIVLHFLSLCYTHTFERAPDDAPAGSERSLIEPSFDRMRDHRYIIDLLTQARVHEILFAIPNIHEHPVSQCYWSVWSALFASMATYHRQAISWKAPTPHRNIYVFFLSLAAKAPPSANLSNALSQLVRLPDITNYINWEDIRNLYVGAIGPMTAQPYETDVKTRLFVIYATILFPQEALHEGSVFGQRSLTASRLQCDTVDTDDDDKALLLCGLLSAFDSTTWNDASTRADALGDLVSTITGQDAELYTGEQRDQVLAFLARAHVGADDDLSEAIAAAQYEFMPGDNEGQEGEEEGEGEGDAEDGYEDV